MKFKIGDIVYNKKFHSAHNLKITSLDKNVYYFTSIDIGYNGFFSISCESFYTNIKHERKEKLKKLYEI